jgi:hypothetical protein
MSEEVNLREITRWLEHGDLANIARELGLDPKKADIYRFAAGKAKNPRVDLLERMIKKATENKTRIMTSYRSLQVAGTKS